MKCRYCEREVEIPCRSSRCMEDANSEHCYDALMRIGGGENCFNQGEAQRRAAVFKHWKLCR